MLKEWSIKIRICSVSGVVNNFAVWQVFCISVIISMTVSHTLSNTQTINCFKLFQNCK